jgi:hypothetical protein
MRQTNSSTYNLSKNKSCNAVRYSFKKLKKRKLPIKAMLLQKGDQSTKYYVNYQIVQQ